MHDVFGNSIALVTFAEPASQLIFESSFRAEHFPATSREIIVESYADRFPFSYSADDTADLGRTEGPPLPRS